MSKINRPVFPLAIPMLSRIADCGYSKSEVAMEKSGPYLFCTFVVGLSQLGGRGFGEFVPDM
jgi:hypothetical protein